MAAAAAGSAAAGSGLSTALGSVGALFGLAGALSQATASKRAIDRANEEAAIAIAQAKDNISRIPDLELGIPTIAMEQIQKDSLRNRKQLLDAVRGSGQRSVLGAVPVVGEQILTQEEKNRGILEKELLARDKAIIQAEQKQQDLELQMLTATGTAAQKRAAAAANTQALAVASAGRSVGALGSSLLEGSDLFGGEKRRFNRAVDAQIQTQPDLVSENFDREGFVDFINTKTQSTEEATDLLNDPENNLMREYLTSGEVVTEISGEIT